MRCLPTSVRPAVSSVPHRLSCGHISKTVQDRPIVTMEHHIEVGSADSVAAFRSSPEVSDKKYAQILIQHYGLLFNRADRRHRRCCQQCCKQSAMVRTCCSHSLSVELMTAKSNKRWASFFSPCIVLFIVVTLSPFAL